MPYRFFNNAIQNGLSQMPNEAFRDRQQAAINAGFDVTTNKYCIKEQDNIGSETYHDIDAWIGNAMGMTTRGMANGNDFKTLTFKSIGHEVQKGLYYKFDGDTWLTHFTDNHASLDVVVGIRRCDNVMKIIDPDNGSVFCTPCAVEYDMTAPAMQVANAILTPNNHATVKVQGNENTYRLFKTNTRYIFGGRVFKLLGYQNANNDRDNNSRPSLITLDLFLDERHEADDLERQIADNGTYNYSLEINSHSMEVLAGSTGTLKAIVTLNGEEVNRKVIWESLSSGIVEIDSNGDYIVNGTQGDSATIIATLDGNEDVYDEVTITIGDIEDIEPKVLIEPQFDSIREHETIEFRVMASYGGKLYSPTNVGIEYDNTYLSLSKQEGLYKITSLGIDIKPQTLRFSIVNDYPRFSAQSDVQIKTLSMLG